MLSDIRGVILEMTGRRDRLGEPLRFPLSVVSRTTFRE